MLATGKEPTFHLVNTVFFLGSFFSASFLENLAYAALWETNNELSFNQFLIQSVLASHSFKALHLGLGIRDPCPFWEDLFFKKIGQSFS